MRSDFCGNGSHPYSYSRKNIDNKAGFDTPYSFLFKNNVQQALGNESLFNASTSMTLPGTLHQIGESGLTIYPGVLFQGLPHRNFRDVVQAC